MVRPTSVRTLSAAVLILDRNKTHTSVITTLPWICPQADLLTACKDGELELVRQLLARGSNLEYTDEVSVRAPVLELQGSHESDRAWWSSA